MGLAILIYIKARIVPGDLARIALGSLASAQQVEEMRQEMGTNKKYGFWFIEEIKLRI